MSTTLIEQPNPFSDQDVTLTFKSEALGLPPSLGYGWPQLRFGARVGPNSRYEITRKLGWGLNSSIWLARDAQTRNFVAVKVLTSHYTQLTREGQAYEARVSRSLQDPWPSSPHCPTLLDEFIEPGIGTDGEHLCLVMPLYGGSVKNLLEINGGRFPPSLSKRIILHMLRGLALAHSKQIVHTDLKLDNILYTTDIRTEGIEKWLADDPSRYHEPEQSHECMVQAAASQPLPVISWDEAMRATFVVADWGSAIPGIQGGGLITPEHLRPPEVILGDMWGPAADIWTFGVLAYHLITSSVPFKYVPDEKYGLTEDENMLHQMMCFTNDDFRAKQLQRSPRAPLFFNADCSLKKETAVVIWLPRNRTFRTIPDIDVEQVPAIAAFIDLCIKLNPEDRPTAKELLEDPWFKDFDDYSN